jgi:PAS domain S-box-containing protein
VLPPGRADWSALVGEPVETRGRRPGGAEFPVELTLTRSGSGDEPVLLTAFVQELAGPRSPDARSRQLSRLHDAAEQLARMGSWELDLRSGRALWSDEMYRISGMEPGEMTPTIDLLLQLVHRDDRAHVADVLSTVVDRPGEVPAEGIRIDYRIVRPDGSLREIRAHGRIEWDDNREPLRWVGSGQDVTDERTTERELMAHHAVAQALRSWESFDEGVIGLLRRLGTALDLPIGSLWGWDTDRQRLRSRAFWFAPGVDVADFDLTVRESAFGPGEGLAGHAWRSGRPVIVEDLRTDLRSGNRPAAARLGLRSGLAFPAMSERGPVAVLTYYGFDTRLPNERLVATLSGIGQQLGGFLGRRRAELGGARLSGRELEILRLATEGNSGRQIAEQLIVSPATVKTHFENIYEKLGVGDRAAAVAYALRLGLIQ